MRKPLVTTAVVAVLLLGAFGALFSSGAVFGQETGPWRTVKAVVQTRVLRAEMVHLADAPERYVVRGEGGRARFDALMRDRGFTHVEQMGGGHSWVDAAGRRCVSSSRQFTHALRVFSVPTCG